MNPSTNAVSKWFSPAPQLLEGCNQPAKGVGVSSL